MVWDEITSPLFQTNLLQHEDCISSTKHMISSAGGVKLNCDFMFYIFHALLDKYRSIAWVLLRCDGFGRGNTCSTLRDSLRCCVFNVSSLHVDHYCCCRRLCAFEGWSRKALDSLCRRCWKEQNRRRKYHNLGQEIRTQKHHQMLHTMVNQTLQIQIQKKNQNGNPP